MLGACEEGDTQVCADCGRKTQAVSAGTGKRENGRTGERQRRPPLPLFVPLLGGPTSGTVMAPTDVCVSIKETHGNRHQSRLHGAPLSRGELGPLEGQRAKLWQCVQQCLKVRSGVVSPEWLLGWWQDEVERNLKVAHGWVDYVSRRTTAMNPPMVFALSDCRTHRVALNAVKSGCGLPTAPCLVLEKVCHRRLIDTLSSLNGVPKRSIWALYRGRPIRNSLNCRPETSDEWCLGVRHLLIAMATGHKRSAFLKPL